MAVGIAFLALGAFAFYIGTIISSIFALTIGAALSGYSLLIPSEKQISKKLQKGMVGGFLELGKKKIDNGSVKVDYENFRNTVEKISPVISQLSTMPELGFDSIYLHYSRENDAEITVEAIREMALDASIVQNKGDWAVRVEIEEHQIPGNNR